MPADARTSEIRLIGTRLILLPVIVVGTVVVWQAVSYVAWRRTTSREAELVEAFLAAMPRADRLIVRGRFCDDMPSMFVLTDPEEIAAAAAPFRRARPVVDYRTSWELRRGAALATTIAGTIEIEADEGRRGVHYLGPRLLVVGDSTVVRLEGFDMHEVHEILTVGSEPPAGHDADPAAEAR